MGEEATLAEIIALLDKAATILTKEIPQPDAMYVSEWNATPIGRAVGAIGEALSLLEDLE
jgi:hypothetical protein